MTLNLGILIAFACAVATQLGFLYKHKGACAAAKVDIRHPLKTVKALFSSRWFAIGMAVALGAWILHVAAMALAPISVVQAVLSTGVVILAVMAERLFGFEVGRRQWLGVAMTAAGLVLLVVTLPAHSGSHSGFSVAGMISFEAGMLAIGALLITGPRIGAPDHHHGVMLGAAAGVLFGVSDVAIKALTGARRRGDPRDPALALARGDDHRLGRGLLRLRPRPAGRRGRAGHRLAPPPPPTSPHHGRHRRLRRPDARRHARHRACRCSPSCSCVVAALIVPPPLRAAEANAQLA